MALKSSRPRGDDDDDEDDRPRRRRREDDDDDEDDRPRSRRSRDDDDDDDRPLRRRRDDEDDRPRRRPKRKSRGPSTGLILGIVGGVLAIAGIVVAVVLLVRGGIGGANISHAKFREINGGATIESLEKSFGRATKLDRSEWSKVRVRDSDFGGGSGRFGARGETLADLVPGGMVDAWYHWHSGSEDIYVAEGKRFDGKQGLIMKAYANSNAMRENSRANGDMSKMVPGYEISSIN